jgi:hypothetical protein
VRSSCCAVLAASLLSAGIASAQELPEEGAELPPVEDAIPETPSEDESRNPSGVIDSGEEAAPTETDSGEPAPIEEHADETPDAEGDEETFEESDEPARPAPRWTEERSIAWITFLTSIGVGIGGAVVLALGVDDINTVENAPDGTIWTDVSDAQERAPILTGVGAVVLGLGAAGAAVGAALLAYFGENGTWLEVSALPGGLRVRGTF